MKIAKRVAGLLAFGLVAATAGLAVGAAAPAQATTGNVSYTCGLINGILHTLTPYNNVNLAISVSPSSVAEGQKQTITLNLGGNGTTAAGSTVPFNNGPFVGSTEGGYQAIFSISIDDADPINVVSSTPNAVSGVNEAVFPNGVTGSIDVTKAQGTHTVKLQQFIVNSTGSGPSWGETGDPTDVSKGVTFDSICNAGDTQATIVGNGAPEVQGSATPQPESYLAANPTDFTVTAADPDQPKGTVTTLGATPASPQEAGTSVKFTANVSASSGSPAGTVQFKSDGSNIGSPVTLASGKADFSTSSLAVGTHAITAAFTSSDSTGGDGFTDSVSSALSYTISPAETTTTPTPTPSDTSSSPSTAPVSASATLAKVYCETYSKADAGQGSVSTYSKWPAKITVSPGAAAPGSTVKVSVAVNASPNNGPATELKAQSYKFQAAVSFQGKSVMLTDGTVNSSAVALNAPIYTKSQLPTVTSGTITLPSSEGSFPVKLTGLYYNNVKGSIATSGLTDPFDNICNASTQPNDSPKAFNSPSVSVVSDASAPKSTESASPTDDSGSGGDNSGVLAATGGREVVILALLALLALQIGVVVTVRAHRSAPRGPRHL